MEEQLKSGKWDRRIRVEIFNEDISTTGTLEPDGTHDDMGRKVFLKDEETCADGGGLLCVTENFNHVN